MPAISTEYRKALPGAVIFQVVFGLFAAMILDCGMLLTAWGISMVGYWIGVAMMIQRRPAAPTKTDLFLVRWGFPMIFPIGVMLLANLAWLVLGLCGA